ncbi:MAG: carboxymuconolactone decarboxylase family protein [Gemmatimonadales bacterium]|jgi:AhpD family alkylhydroperoxidase
MTLNRREKEYISVGASVAAGCKNCFESHVKEARFQGVTDEELVESMNIGLDVREHAQAIAKEHGLRVLGRKLTQLVHLTGEVDEGTDAEAPPGARIEELTALASAIAVNCETSLNRHRANARMAGATDEEIQEAIRISRFIKGKADSLCCKRI